MYKFEIHLHSSGCSGCATSDSIELVEVAKVHGYAGVVFTNHFYRGNTALDRNLPWDEFVTAYEEDYLKAKEYGDKIGIIPAFAGIIPNKWDCVKNILEKTENPFRSPVKCDIILQNMCVYPKNITIVSKERDCYGRFVKYQCGFALSRSG